MLYPRLENHFEGKNIFVDLGCGSGEILDALVERYKYLFGLDAFLTRLKKRELKPQKWNFVQTDLNEKFPLKSNWADTVLANQVIEHMLDPQLFVKEIYRILRSGGVSIITTPNIRYIKNLWRISVQGIGPRTAGGNTIDGSWDDGHLHYFTHKDLIRLYRKVGFSRVLTKGFIDLKKSTWIRCLANNYSNTALVREFLSGNILLVAKK